MFLLEEEEDANLVGMVPMTVRREILQFIDQLLQYYQWSSKIPVPHHRLLVIILWKKDCSGRRH
jgi:hypothetical protein